MRMRMRPSVSGFSLVELSIVLVILGLLTGGILTGQSLIRAAELRAVTTEFNEYQTAVRTFQEKYFALPGDMPNATQFWGRADTGAFTGQCANPTNDIGSGTQTCNGNGNGNIAGTGSTEYETFRFWQHLANANLINGNFTGIRGPSSTIHAVIRENSPASKVSNAGWSARNYNFYGGDSETYPSNFVSGYGNIYDYGAQTSSNSTRGAVLTPEEVWNIDTKIDDGKPAQGKVIVRRRNACTTTGSANDLNAEYLLSNTNNDCAIIFRQVF